MNQESFQSFIDRCGSNELQWPNSPEGDEARNLLEQSSWARSILNEHQEVHRLLNVAMSVDQPMGLESGILDRVATVRERTWTHHLTQWLLKPALVALPLAIGYVFGLTATDSSIFLENEITATQFDDHSDLLAISHE